MIKVTGNQRFFTAWVKYINLCKRRQDLYEYMEEYGIGTFSHECVTSMARFYEEEGDPRNDELTPIIDYRRSNLIYITAEKNLKALLGSLNTLKDTEP